MWAHSLLAADDPLTRSEVLYGIAGIVVALLAGAVAISLADKWRKRAAAPMQHDETDMLTTYRDMYEHGEITEAEYTELRRKIADKVKSGPAPKPPELQPGPTGRPDPAKLAIPARPAPAAKLDPPEPPAGPPDPPPSPGTS